MAQAPQVDFVQAAILEGHTNDIHVVAFSPDGKTLAFTSWDRTIRLWNVSQPLSLRP